LIDVAGAPEVTSHCAGIVASRLLQSRGEQF